MCRLLRKKRKISFQFCRLVVLTVSIFMHSAVTAQTAAENLEFWSGVAGSAGLLIRCGLPQQDGMDALERVNEVLFCQSRDGKFSKEEGKAYSMQMIQAFENGRSQKEVPPPEVCASAKFLIKF